MLKKILLISLLCLLLMGNADTETPEPPVLIAGAQAAIPLKVIYDNPVILQWEPRAGTATYRLKISGSKGWRARVILSPSNCNATTCQVLITLGNRAQRYKWSVKARNANGAKIGRNQKDSFRTAKPPKPAFISPYPGERVQESIVTFRWEASVGTESYYVFLIDRAKRKYKSERLDADTVCPGGLCSYVAALGEGRFRWYVRADGLYGKSKTRKIGFKRR